MKILITGAAGFIGFHLVEKLVTEGHQIIGIDNINDYYDPELKFSRLSECGIKRSEIRYAQDVPSNLYKNYKFIQLDLANRKDCEKLFSDNKFDQVIHLAAQAGVRYSIENPHAYIESNIVGFLHILEGVRQNNISRLIYASSSSIYGNRESVPFKEEDNVDKPISLYAATKKSNELMAHTYSHLYNIQTIGLRFFTVYGPWGRPDMAPFIFAKNIIEEKSIKIFNHGNMERDFTYVSDIIEGISKIANHPSKDEKYAVYNIGNSEPINLLNFIENIEQILGKKAKKIFLPIPPGDVQKTFSDITKLQDDFNYKPDTKLNDGLENFISWYKSYYKKNNKS